MAMADRHRKLGNPNQCRHSKDAATARRFGAEGIGLCRTEHMFFDKDRIDAVREMIVAENKADRQIALEKPFAHAAGRFSLKFFKEMKDCPVTIRLLDPPLHEFLPQTEDEITILAKKLGIPFLRLKNKVKGLHEFNPMLGHRGVRLGITFPEIYAMQARAIAEAAAELTLKHGFTIIPEIMIPLVGMAKEVKPHEGPCRRRSEEGPGRNRGEVFL